MSHACTHDGHVIRATPVQRKAAGQQYLTVRPCTNVFCDDVLAVTIFASHDDASYNQVVVWQDDVPYSLRRAVLAGCETITAEQDPHDMLLLGLLTEARSYTKLEFESMITNALWS